MEGKALTRVEGADWELPNTGDGTEDGMADVDESSVEDHADCAPASPLDLLLAMLENPKTALSCGPVFQRRPGRAAPVSVGCETRVETKHCRRLGQRTAHTHARTHTLDMDQQKWRGCGSYPPATTREGAAGSTVAERIEHVPYIRTTPVTRRLMGRRRTTQNQRHVNLSRGCS